MENTTQIVGWFYCTKTNKIFIFLRLGSNDFNWNIFPSTIGSHEISTYPGVKIFAQEPHLELYQAQTWDDAKKWF